ncbi:hypothetical protein HYX10_04155 [Candidatus Woesearchaeota archaeon]|nr:hypothetical protein [Candidatus Woesearchaeota archaeon]
MKEDPVYIGIEEPADVRRALLESSKNLISLLQENEGRKEQRKQKRQLLAELTNAMNEVKKLTARLKAEMPKVKMSSLPKAAKMAETPGETRKTAPKRYTSEAQKLEHEMAEIEEKLSRL